jgi:hypothetical protein
VPEEGKADTVMGEMARAVAKLNYRYGNDGDMYWDGYGIETCGSAAIYLMSHCPLHQQFDTIMSNMEHFVSEDNEYTDKDSYYVGLGKMIQLLLDTYKQDPQAYNDENQIDSVDDYDDKASEAFGDAEEEDDEDYDEEDDKDYDEED